MAFRKINSDNNREIELPTLIDVMFLLLVFFVATLTISSGGDPKSSSAKKDRLFDLPRAQGKASIEQNKNLSTLLFLIQHKDAKDSSSSKVVYILWPDEQRELTEAQVFANVANGLKKQPADSNDYYATFPADFLAMSEAELRESRPFRLIARNIEKYQQQHFLQPSLSNTIEIKAARDTEFKIIRFILNECGSYKKLIPKVTFRVLSAQETKEGAKDGI